jgi:hypothetical protein
LERTNNAKYLGVNFDSKLTWQHHVEEINQKATKRSTLLKRLAGKKKCGSSRTTLTTRKIMYPPLKRKQ